MNVHINEQYECAYDLMPLLGACLGLSEHLAYFSGGIGVVKNHATPSLQVAMIFT